MFWSDYYKLILGAMCAGLILFLLVILFLAAFIVITDKRGSKKPKKNEDSKMNEIKDRAFYNVDMTRNTTQEIIQQKDQSPTPYKKQHCDKDQEDTRQRSSQQPDHSKEQQMQESTKITINKKSQYKPDCLKAPLQFPDKMPNPQNDKRQYLLLERHAQNRLKKSLDWGKKTKRNIVEQGGVLLGHVCYYENEIYCYVSDILLADTRGDSAFVEFTSEMWAAMQNGLSKINTARAKDDQLVIVGWFHTHPNGLSVFMSGTDMNTQRLNFSQRWQASLVLNPHTRKCRAFFGLRADDGKIVYVE